MLPKLKSNVLSEPVLVGREQEIADLEHHLELAMQGKGRTVFISGEAGSGKTRLTREFLNLAKKKEVALMAGWCLSDTEIPYFPFTEAFSGYFTSFDEEPTATLQSPNIQIGLESTAQIGSKEAGIAEWLTRPMSVEGTGKSELISPQVWKDRAFASVTKTLTSISNQVPVILFIEDMHWADSASLALLHYIARAVSNSERILVVATFRSEELTADEEGHPHPLAETLRAMRREDLFTEIKLPSLNQTTISRIAANMIGGNLSPELVEKLTAESRGNPLFVVESLRMLHERKNLIQQNNLWLMVGDELGIPTKIKDIILRRLAVLKYAQRRVLDAASVIGEKFDVELLSIVLGLDALEVLETLNVIEHSTSLVSAEDNHYRFDHARSRETLYEGLSVPLKRGYHGKIAEKLETLKSPALPLSDLAFHFSEAGNKEKALKYAFAAAKDELTRFSNSQAIKHFTYVLQSISDEAAHVEEKRTALEGLGDAYAANSMYIDAIKTFGELAKTNEGAGRLRALRKAMDAAFLKGDAPEVLLEYSKKAEELAAYDRIEYARVIDNRGRAFGFAGRGDPKMDLADYDAALQVFQEENSVADAADALWRCGAVRTMFENSSVEGFAELERSVAIFRELGDVRKEVEATLHLFISFWNCALIPESLVECSKVLELGGRIGCYSEMAQVTNRLAYSPAYESKINEAISIQLKALEHWKKTDLEWLGCCIYGDLIQLHVRLGDIKRAEEYEKKLSEMNPEALNHLMAVYNVVVGRASLSAAKNQWQVEPSDVSKKIPFALNALPIVDCAFKGWYGWILKKQGKLEESKNQLSESTKVIEQAGQKYVHANIQANLMMPRKAQVGDEIELRIDLVNVARTPASLTRIEGLIKKGCFVTGFPPFCSLQNGTINLNGKTINPFTVETIKLKLKASIAGSFNFNPSVTYIDDQRDIKTAQITQIALSIEAVKPTFDSMPGRITTGYADLDDLLLGGIPEKCSVALTAPSTQERQLLIDRFLKAGAEADVPTVYITCEPGNALSFAQQFQSSFSLLVCNLQADLIAKDLPNIFKLKGIDNLTEIDIVMAKFFKSLNTSQIGQRRACIGVISDALLEHHALITRKWLGSFLLSLKSKGFTVLAFVDPQMHPLHDLQAVLSVFDGEIRITERETPEGVKQTLRIKRLINQRFSDKEITLNREALTD